MWFKVDDKLHSHPKWIGLSPSAKALWVTAGSWCSDQLCDGFVPVLIVKRLGFAPRHAQELNEAGMWDAAEGGWEFHDWRAYQPTRKDVEENRIREREEGTMAREEEFEGSQMTHVHRGVHGGLPDVSTVSRPDPTRPEYLRRYVCSVLEDVVTSNPNVPLRNARVSIAWI